MGKELAATTYANKCILEIHNLIKAAFLAGVAWRDDNPIKSSVDIGFKAMFDADDYESTIKHFRDESEGYNGIKHFKD